MNAPRRRSPGLTGVLVLLATGFGAGACSRAHLTATHGRAFREAFAAQDANANRGKAKSVFGLDSQEAAIISGSYRKALAPQAAPTGQSQQLVMTNTAAGAAPVPTTSVPSN